MEVLRDEVAHGMRFSCDAYSQLGYMAIFARCLF